MIFHIMLAGEISFVFVVVNETLTVRSIRLPALFSKNGIEDLERPCRIFTVLGLLYLMRTLTGN